MPDTTSTDTLSRESLSRIACPCGHSFGLSTPTRLILGPTPIAYTEERVWLICPKCGKVKRWNPDKKSQKIS